MARLRRRDDTDRKAYRPALEAVTQSAPLSLDTFGCRTPFPALEIESETVGVAKLTDEGRSTKSVQQLLQANSRPGPEPVQRDSAREALKEILVAADGQSLNSEAVKQQVKEKTGVSPATTWRAFARLKNEGLAGAAPTRDEEGKVTEWRWFAKAELLLGRASA